TAGRTARCCARCSTRRRTTPTTGRRSTGSGRRRPSPSAATPATTPAAPPACARACAPPRAMPGATPRRKPNRPQPEGGFLHACLSQHARLRHLSLYRARRARARLDPALRPRTLYVAVGLQPTPAPAAARLGLGAVPCRGARHLRRPPRRPPDADR